MTAIVGESMDRKISWEPNIQGTITDGVLIFHKKKKKSESHSEPTILFKTLVIYLQLG